MTGRAVVGPQTGKRLAWFPTEVTTWKAWRAKHPQTTVLKPPRPLSSYRRVNRGYDLYRASDQQLFELPGVKKWPATYRNKDVVTIVETPTGPRCYPHPALKDGETKDGDLTIVKRGLAVKVLGKDGEEIPAMQGYWFAWWAFYRDGTVYEPKGK